MHPEMIEPPGMKNQMALNISLAVVLSAAVATVALRAAARRQDTRSVPGAGHAPVTVTVGENRPRSALTAGTQDGAGHEMARPPSPSGRPASVVEQMQHVFHELHADGRNVLCAVCDSQYRPA
jgi:hypothetical protein